MASTDTAVRRPVLYHFARSGPSRIAVLAARVVGVDVDIKPLNLFAKEQLNPEFLKINPQHCVPTLDDNGFHLWESRAIAVYFATKYENDSLYPRDPKRRAVVDQRLYFDAGTLYPRIRAICYPILYLGETTVSDEKKRNLTKAFEFLDTFLQDGPWVAGDCMTLADVACVASASSIQAVGYDISHHKNVSSWMERCKSTMPGFAENQLGANEFGETVRSKLPNSQPIWLNPGKL